MTDIKIDEDHFIAEVEKYPHLWQTNHRDHKDTVKRQNSYSEIGETFGISGDAATKKWKSLRTIYAQSKKKQPPSGSATGPVAPQWRHYQRMLFVDEYVLPRSRFSYDSSRTGLSVKNEGSDNQNTRVSEQNADDKQSTDNTENSENATPNRSAAQNQKARRKRTMPSSTASDVDVEFLNVVKSLNEPDTVGELFGKKVTVMLAKLPVKKQRSAMRRIEDILYDADDSCSAELSQHLTPSRVSSSYTYDNGSEYRMTSSVASSEGTLDSGSIQLLPSQYYA